MFLKNGLFSGDSVTIPVYITVRDYGSAAAAMVRRLLAMPGCRPVVVDNASTWEPWLAWMDDAPCEVIRNTTNRGPRAGLEQAILRRHESPYYIITDGDLDLDGVPLDAIDILRECLEASPETGKVGLSLRIDDIPESAPIRSFVLSVESRYWGETVEVAGWKWHVAPIDTTFAMLRSGEGYTAYEPALRAVPPYCARHLPWYFTRDNVTPAYLYYLRHAGGAHAGGTYYSTLARDGKLYE